MRDALIEQIYLGMKSDKKLFFVSADFGSPVLDKIRKEFSSNFINVGIAEQNLVNVVTGLALEGFVVYAYAIAPFLSMRAYEQIRTNLALLSQLKPVNVNLISVGAGISYDVSGPTHHCLEDIALMRLLPNIMVFSPSDWVLSEKFFKVTCDIAQPKYIRLDAKPLPAIYSLDEDIDFTKGFAKLKEGSDVCLISTGYMTHKALNIAEMSKKENINCSVIDIFMIKPLDLVALQKVLCKFKKIFVLEESFTGKGGLDSLVYNLIREANIVADVRAFGFKDEYVFELGSRTYLHEYCGLSDEVIMKAIKDTF
ncbi:MAG: transketolase [Candidatus Omnitrophica bacterium]|nr:transketolase [Candidatus Omnitrophota bacterium]